MPSGARGNGEGEDPAHVLSTPMMQFAQPADRLPPTESLFHEFSFDLAHLEAGMPGGPCIDGALRPPRVKIRTHMRRRVARPDTDHEVRHVIALM